MLKEYICKIERYGKEMRHESIATSVGIHAKENRKTEIFETKFHNCFHILKLLLSLKKNIKWLQNLR